tara:strand:+ start:514 stop:834 length:321 start_codon:yes stop_codon:yes gene_type:complete
MKKIKFHKKPKYKSKVPLKLILLNKTSLSTKKYNISPPLIKEDIKHVNIDQKNSLRKTKKTVTKIEKLENFKITNKKNLKYFKNFPNKEDTIICSFISNDINIVKL